MKKNLLILVSLAFVVAGCGTWDEGRRGDRNDTYRSGGMVTEPAGAQPRPEGTSTNGFGSPTTDQPGSRGGIQSPQTSPGTP